MTRLEEKISNLSAPKLYFFRNIFGSLNILFCILFGFALEKSNVSYYLQNLLFLIIISMPLIYVWFAKKIDKVLIDLLVEKIDLDKYEAYWQEHINKLLGGKAQGHHALGVVSFFRGDFEKSLNHFDESKRSRQTKKLRGVLESDRELIVYQDRIFLASSDIEYSEHLSSLGQHTYIQSILDIIYYKQPSLYFKNTKEEKKTKIGKLLYQYYKAENAVLFGNMEEAKAMFTTLSKENPQLFIVQEAKRKLAEMQ